MIVQITDTGNLFVLKLITIGTKFKKLQITPEAKNAHRIATKWAHRYSCMIQWINK